MGASVAIVMASHAIMIFRRRCYVAFVIMHACAQSSSLSPFNPPLRCCYSSCLRNRELVCLLRIELAFYRRMEKYGLEEQL